MVLRKKVLGEMAVVSRHIKYPVRLFFVSKQEIHLNPNNFD